MPSKFWKTFHKRRFPKTFFSNFCQKYGLNNVFYLKFSSSFRVTALINNLRNILRLEAGLERIQKFQLEPPNTVFARLKSEIKTHRAQPLFRHLAGKILKKMKNKFLKMLQKMANSSVFDKQSLRVLLCSNFLSKPEK